MDATTRHLAVTCHALELAWTVSGVQTAEDVIDIFEQADAWIVAIGHAKRGYWV